MVIKSKNCVLNILLVIFVLSINGIPLKAQSRDGSFSSDGSMIVYVSTVNGFSEIFTMDITGKNIRQITNLGYNNYYPFLSPDDSKIVFMSYPKGKATICTINKDGTNLKRLTGENEENADPHWSPDGTKIIFYSERDGNDEIYIMNSNGNNPVRLTNNTASDQTPSISPNGETIVFVSNRDGNSELYIMDINGENVRRLTFDSRSDRVPAWSPDCRKIIWYSRENPDVAGSNINSWNGAEIYELIIDSSVRKQLTHNLFRDHGPVYSPDGSKILFTSGKTGVREIFIMNNEGSEIRQITFSEK